MLTASQLLYAAGFLFMGATDEQMKLVNQSSMDGVAYVLILYSLAFLTFLFVNMLIHLYDRSANADATSFKPANGHIRLNGQPAGDSSRVRDAEEFELDGLMTDDEDEEHAQRRKLLKEEDGDLGTPSTLGRNNVHVA